MESSRLSIGRRTQGNALTARLARSMPGGRYVTDLVVDSTASVGVVAHPSLLDVPKDIHDLNNSSGHFLWLNAGDDYMFNKEKQDEAREIIKGNDKQKMVGESPVFGPLFWRQTESGPGHPRRRLVHRLT